MKKISVADMMAIDVKLTALGECSHHWAMGAPYMCTADKGFSLDFVHAWLSVLSEV